MLVNGKNYRTVWMENSIVKMINQPLLPHKFEIYECENSKQTAESISTMIIRGAGALAIAGAYGMAQVFMESSNTDEIEKGYQILKNTRPTAQNLFYALDHVKEAGLKGNTQEEKISLALKEAERLADEDSKLASKIGEYGEKIIQDGYKILTHCNAGWLAFVDWGTALSPIYKAAENNKNIFVWVDETRPRMQGSRLTAWELTENKIPNKIIADNASAHYMSHKEVDMVITGADRIAINGDTANKIGTMEKAIIANYFNIPFYIAAPSTTIDFDCPNGKSIPIEERDQDEVLCMFGASDNGDITKIRTSPQKAQAANPAFDVTPAGLITGFITEKGILKASELKNLR